MFSSLNIPPVASHILASQLGVCQVMLACFDRFFEEWIGRRWWSVGKNGICACARFEHHVDVTHKVDDLIVGSDGKGLTAADNVI